MTKSCPKGQYYCYTDKKCKQIPKGFKAVGRAGYLRKENGHSVDDNKNGSSNGNGNGNGGNGNGNGGSSNGNGGGVSESKSGDSSLRDWFGKSRSSDGKPGWVQLGGKYAGKPCAKQPGQTTKPKCGSSKMKRNLSKDEEQAAFRRKNAKDPNPNRKGKAINVKTEETQMRSVTEVADFTTLPLNIEIPDNIRDFNLGLMFRESLDTNSGMLFIFEDVAQQSFHMTETKIPLDIAFIKEDGIIESIKQLEPYDKNPVASDGEVICALEVNRGWFTENNVEVGDDLDDIGNGVRTSIASVISATYVAATNLLTIDGNLPGKRFSVVVNEPAANGVDFGIVTSTLVISKITLKGTPTAQASGTYIYTLTTTVPDGSCTSDSVNGIIKINEKALSIIIHACEQNGSNIVPDFQIYEDLSSAIEHDSFSIFFDLDAANDFQSIKTIKDNISLITGPESGFSKREKELLNARASHNISLGKNILRAETAPITALSVIKSNLGLL